MRYNTIALVAAIVLTGSLSVTDASARDQGPDKFSRRQNANRVEKDTQQCDATAKNHKADKRGPKDLIKKQKKHFGHALMKDITLSPEQKSEINEIRKEQEAKRKDWHEDNKSELESIRKQMREAMRDKDRDQMSKLREELRDIMKTAPKPQDTFDEIKDVLNKKQQKQFEKNLKDIREGWDKRRDKGPRGEKPDRADRTREGRRERSNDQATKQTRRGGFVSANKYSDFDHVDTNDRGMMHAESNDKDFKRPERRERGEGNFERSRRPERGEGNYERGPRRERGEGNAERAPRRERGEGDAERGRRPKMGPHTLLRNLDLTEDQKAEIKDIMDDARESHADWREDNAEKLREIRQDMAEARREHDREAMEKLHAKMQRILKSAPDREDVFNDIKDVLTQEQREQLKKNLTRLKKSGPRHDEDGPKMRRPKDHGPEDRDRPRRGNDDEFGRYNSRRGQ